MVFERLTSYIRSVDELFPGPTHRILRTLLKTKETDLLFSIPNLTIDRQADTHVGSPINVIEN